MPTHSPPGGQRKQRRTGSTSEPRVRARTSLPRASGRRRSRTASSSRSPAPRACVSTRRRSGARRPPRWSQRLAGASATAPAIEALVSRFLDSGKVVKVTVTNPSANTQRGSTQEKWTTVELAQTEAELLEQAGQTVVSPDHRISQTVIDGVVAARPELSDEQAVMVTEVCASSRFVLPVEGRPGAGKTYATEAVVATHVAAGIPVVGCAVSAAAASELESQAGFARSVMPATTVAKLLHDLDRYDGLAAGTTVVVDEASMIGTRALAGLVGHVERCGGGWCSSETPTSTARSKRAECSLGSALTMAMGWCGSSRIVARTTTSTDSRSTTTATGSSPKQYSGSTTRHGSCVPRQRGSPSTRWSPTGTPHGSLGRLTR